MTDENLLKNFNNKIQAIYKEQELRPLYIKGKQNKCHEVRFNKIIKTVSNPGFDFQKLYEDILFTSDVIVHFIAHLYLYKPYINNPIKDSFDFNGTTVYPQNTNIASLRYNMYLDTVFEKFYNYWDRMGDLIAAFLPKEFPNEKNVYFSNVITKLKPDFKECCAFTWLLDFHENHFKKFNAERKNIVHYFSKNTEQVTEQLQQVTDSEKTKNSFNKRIDYPNYFKCLNNMSIEGFEKTLFLLEAINQKRNNQAS